MATKLNKAVYRESSVVVRDRSKRRELIIGLLAGDLVEIRMKGTRQAVQIPVEDLWYYGNKLKARQLQAERIAKRKAKRVSNKLTGGSGNMFGFG